MPDESLNSKKTIKHLRRGLSIYKTGRSPFWHARIYDAVKKKYVVRSTKEMNRIEAAEVAEEIVDTYKKKQNTAHASLKERSFEHYAKLLDLPPEAPSFITRVCGFGFHILRCQFGQARRTRSPQIAQAHDARQRVFGYPEMSAV